MFDINDIAKTAFEPVLFTPLQRAQKDGYINITGVDGKKKIEYITSEKHVENYEDPEEKVRAEFFAELIYKYEYPANRIKVEVVVPDRLPTDRADIVVFSDNDCKRPYSLQLNRDICSFNLEISRDNPTRYRYTGSIELIHTPLVLLAGADIETEPVFESQSRLHRTSF